MVTTAVDEKKNSVDVTHPEKIPENLLEIPERKELPKRLKNLTAAAIFYGNFSFACALNTYGPAITTFQNKYETDDATISNTFTILTGCYMVGALCGGQLYNFVNRQFAAILILFTMSAMIFVAPHCTTLGLFFASVAVLGLCSGLYDTCQFVWMMEMMQADCPPYVQGQHFSYALGTSALAFIMAPFLDDEEQDSDNPVETDASNLIAPYSIVGTLVAITGICQVLLFIFMRYYPPPPEVPTVAEIEDTSEKLTSGQEGQPPSKWWSFPKIRMVFLTFCFYGACQGMEMSTFQFYPKFGQNGDLRLTESQSGYTFTGMTTAYAVGRAIAVVAVFKIPCQIILYVNIVMVAIADVVLFFWGQSSIEMLWASGILFGLGVSCMFGAFSAYMERYLNFTNFIGSIMITGGSGTAALYPVIVGNFIEENPIVLCYTIAFSTVVVAATVGTLRYLTVKNKTRY